MELTIEDIGRVRKLILNRPEFMNAFNNALYKAVHDSLKQAEQDAGDGAGHDALLSRDRENEPAAASTASNRAC